MNPKKIVKLSNYIGLIAIFCLVYWVFTFICITVFDLKIFRERMTEIFFLSIFSIIAVMAGALMINIMFNLTRIAEKHNTDQNYTNKNNKIWACLLVLSFPLIGGVLFAGHNLSMSKRQQILISSANSVLTNYNQSIQSISDYHFDKDWINNTAQSLKLLSSTDSQLPHISVIVSDKLENGSKTYLTFNDYRYRDHNTDEEPKKINYLLTTDQQQREYLDEAFKNPKVGVHYERKGSNYKLFVPYQHEGKTVIFLFSDYYAYGKIGS
ncbi:peptidase [Gammaproteobacteria bacterium ESL0073]|nr:peptidase [Gammaproteobacteria bacterium ESL0073]